ncbi:unnamed protein product [Coccothraustes coccothraustes]
MIFGDFFGDFPVAFSAVFGGRDADSGGTVRVFHVGERGWREVSADNGRDLQEIDGEDADSGGTVRVFHVGERGWREVSADNGRDLQEIDGE